MIQPHKGQERRASNKQVFWATDEAHSFPSTVCTCFAVVIYLLVISLERGPFLPRLDHRVECPISFYSLYGVYCVFELRVSPSSKVFLSRLALEPRPPKKKNLGSFGTLHLKTPNIWNFLRVRVKWPLGNWTLSTKVRSSMVSAPHGLGHKEVCDSLIITLQYSKSWAFFLPIFVGHSHLHFHEFWMVVIWLIDAIHAIFTYPLDVHNHQPSKSWKIFAQHVTHFRGLISFRFIWNRYWLVYSTQLVNDNDDTFM